MPTSTRNDRLKESLARSSEITITVKGRKSGRSISIPVWFVWESDKLNLLPVQGSDTQWYKNVLKNPKMRIESKGAEGEFKAAPISDSKQVAAIADQFRKKYGASDVKKYYSKLDVAILAEPQ